MIMKEKSKNIDTSNMNCKNYNILILPSKNIQLFDDAGSTKPTNMKKYQHGIEMENLPSHSKI